MRIAVVSSHYPPDFVSGGTLVAQQLARQMRHRGHDVRVFAGWLGIGRDDHRRALSTWDEIDETGLPIRWVKVTPFHPWDERRNFDNPGVAAALGRVLSDHRADVVHLHSLQAMGAGLVPCASATGARVVVTMHDFWWVCGRQFLVDRDHHPCSLVVEAGECSCQRDRPWLDERNRFLRGALEPADLVLAPSRSATDVLAANGVAPARLATDENGIRESAVRIQARSGEWDHSIVRFRYAGGWSPMKGAPVLLEAVERLARRVPRGWTLIAHGLVQPGTAPPRVPAAVTLAPAYAPAELDDVLAATDVLVLPSVMRETHSMLTREALLRGVPVLTTDCLGPEEVVTDGRNGLVVPADDPEALMLAMERLTCDRELFAGLRAGCRTVPPVRTVDEQVDGLLAAFEALGHRPIEKPVPPLRRVVWMVGIDGAPLRYRARLPAEALGLLGVDTEVLHYRDHRLPGAIAGADALVVYRVPATVQVLDLIASARTAGVTVVFDVDDLIFDADLAAEIPALRLLEPDAAALWLEGVQRYRATMEACDGFVGSTAMLVDHARTVVGVPAEQFDNGVGLILARRSDRALASPRTAGPLRVGYLSGTTTHDEDWRYVEPAVAAVLTARPTVELWLGGHLPPSNLDAAFPGRVRRLPFLPWLDLPALLRDLDVNLAPLAPGGRFNEAKSAIKWLEAAMTETPTVASPTGPYCDAMDHGVNGLLAATPAEWESMVLSVLDDPLLRRRVGARARRDALLRWSPHLQAQRYLAILQRARAWSGSKPTRSAADVRFDEPFSRDVGLEPYDDPAAVVAATPVPRRRVMEAMASAWRSVPHDAVRRTGRRIVRSVGRRPLTGRDNPARTDR